MMLPGCAPNYTRGRKSHFFAHPPKRLRSIRAEDFNGPPQFWDGLFFLLLIGKKVRSVCLIAPGNKTVDLPIFFEAIFRSDMWPENNRGIKKGSGKTMAIWQQKMVEEGGENIAHMCGSTFFSFFAFKLPRRINASAMSPLPPSSPLAGRGEKGVEAAISGKLESVSRFLNFPPFPPPNTYAHTC